MAKAVKSLEQRNAKLERDRKLARQRLNRRVAGKTIHLMNDTKWREVMALWNRRGEFGVNVAFIKLLGGKEQAVFGGFPTMGPSACDGFPGPFEYREIEWMRFPRTSEYKAGKDNKTPMTHEQDLTRFRQALEVLGQLPIEDESEGIRIVGYRN